MSGSKFGLPGIILMENPPGIKTVMEDGASKYMLSGIYEFFAVDLKCQSITHREIHCASFPHSPDASCSAPTARRRMVIWIGVNVDVRGMSLAEVLHLPFFLPDLNLLTNLDVNMHQLSNFHLSIYTTPVNWQVCHGFQKQPWNQIIHQSHQC
jgi:hypothetical protein